MTRFKTTLRALVPVTLMSFAVPAQSQVMQPSQPTVFHVDVVARTIKAINYHHRQGWTNLTLVGSALAPRAKGEVKVDSRTGATKVEAYIEKVPPASTLSDGYLTYVLWAITPEGRAENMGELMLDGDHAKLQAATELQTFGMIVTAEPYYAVTQPSDYIVMEAVVNQDTAGTIMPVEAKYELVARGGYLQQLQPADRVRLREAKRIPLDLMEARQAMAVAHAAGADRYAPDTIAKANIDLSNAEGFLQSGQDRKRIETLARHVTQLAEDARLISVRKADDEALARERSDNERRASELSQAAANEAALRRNAELEAQRKNNEAVMAQQQAADARRATEQVQAQSTAALAEKDRQLAIEAERSRAAAAEAELARTKQRLLEAEAANARTSAQATEMRNRELEEQAKAAREAAQRAEEERVQMRAELTRQLNLVLETRQTARGLIVNMSDVLFDTGQHTLKPGAREKLAKVAGIVLAHPGLKIEVEGHTDSTGGPLINQPLSERRAASVRAYLISQGLDPDSITSRGFGDSKPVADNNSAAGRQANRRVELVVNGPMLSNPQTSSAGGR